MSAGTADTSERYLRGVPRIEPLSKQGRTSPAYEYEGAEFRDTLHFKEGIGGELLVTYCRGQEGSRGEGYVGSLTEDMIETRT